MITLSTDNELIAEGLTVGQQYRVMHNCINIKQAFTATTTVNTEIVVEDGVYLISNLGTPNNNQAYFHYDDTCGLIENFDCKLMHLYTALKLTPQCPTQYTKLCELYTEFNNLLNSQCNDCV